jgi:secondary thiamine-phosphate synthase enzyme
MHVIRIRTERRTQWVDITAQVRDAVASRGVKDGVVTVFVPHTTAGVTINEGADPDVMADVERALELLVPWSGPWRHSEGNSAAHIKATLVGSSVQVIVEEGQLRLGVWQAIYLCEFDGPRTREVWVREG